MSKVIYCPVNGWDCPYFDANGCCMMYPDTDPIKECDDFASVWEEGDDYIVDLVMSKNDSDFLDYCSSFFTEEEWFRLCDLLEKAPEEDYEPDVDETFYDPYMGCDFYE